VISLEQVRTRIAVMMMRLLIPDTVDNKQAVWPPGSTDTVCPRPSVTMTFDRLTLKLVCESHLRWGNIHLAR